MAVGFLFFSSVPLIDIGLLLFLFFDSVHSIGTISIALE